MVLGIVMESRSATLGELLVRYLARIFVCSLIGHRPRFYYYENDQVAVFGRGREMCSRCRKVLFEG